ncbi:MAG TPA: F0F1 ATP synthase subunit delta [Capsulimonadaceae bacterium]|nr:F0F1 ATP synthase subunit delta [Capsulimonadaceae bacterium]
MAQEIRVAKRYAAALFDVALRGDSVEAVANDLTVVELFVREVPYLRAVLMQPLITEQRKRKVLSDAFGERIAATTLNFLYLMVRKRRENVLDETITEFRRLADEHANRVVAHVSSVVPLSEEQLSTLARALQRRTGKNVHIEAQVDDTMLGGVRVRIGDEVIDGGLRTQLERLRGTLLGSS